MSTVTTRLGLTKPAGIEQFNLATYNNNLDLIDGYAVNTVEKLAKGYVAYAELAGNSGGINTRAVFLNIASFTFRANRNYRIGISGNVSVDATGSTFAAVIGTCSTADAANLTTGITNIRGAAFTFDKAGEGRGLLDGIAKEKFMFASDTTLQIKATAERVVGTTGSVTINSSANDRACLFIQDLGVQI